MRDHLPPMQALRCFEATARLSSISRAAQELCVTQGAVSKQIKLLESFLKILVFERTTKGVILTPQGREYLTSVINALDLLDASAQALLSSPNMQQLLLDVIPSFSNLWLIPHLTSFESHFKHLKVDLINGDGQPDFQHSQADIAIRCLKPAQAKNHYNLLFKERLLLVASPELLRSKPINSLQDLISHRLLQQNTRPQLWLNFLQDQQIFTPPNTLNLGIGFQHFFMSLKAAQEGLGLALIPDFLAADAIANNSIANPLNLSMHSQYGYYVICPEHKMSLRKIAQFNQWLAREITD